MFYITNIELQIILQCAGVPTGEQLPALPDSPVRGGAGPARVGNLLYRGQRRTPDGGVLPG